MQCLSTNGPAVLRTLFWLALSVIAWSSTTHVDAAPVTYAIIKEQSSLTLGGTLANGSVTLVPQLTGSNTAALQGSLVGDLTGSSLTFSGSSNIDAAAFAGGTLVPSSAATGSGAVEDNFGFKDHLTGNISQAALRDVALDLVGGSATFGGAVTGLSFAYANGVVDTFNGLQTTFGVLNMQLLDVFADQSAGVLGHVINGNTETITIPIAGTVTFDLFPLDGTDDSMLTMTGQIVAERLISTPEPSTLWMLAFAGTGLAAIRRRVR